MCLPPGCLSSHFRRMSASIGETGTRLVDRLPRTRYSSRHFLLLAVVQWLDVGGAPEHTDYVMVLPGHASTRPFVAASLIRLGLADHVLIPKTETGPDEQDGIIPPNHEIEAAVLRCRGVETNLILALEGNCSGTDGDARALGRFLKNHPQARVSIVTSAFHTRRARWTFHNAIPDLTHRIHFVSAPNPGFRTERWWRTEAGLSCVCSEYLKLAFYWCRYGTGLYWIGGALLAAIAATWVRWRREWTCRAESCSAA